HRHVVEGGQPVATLVVGTHHLAAVGDHDAGQTVLVAVPGAALVRVDAHLAGQHRIVGGTGRGAYDFDLAAVGGPSPVFRRRRGRGGHHAQRGGGGDGRRGRPCGTKGAACPLGAPRSPVS